MDAPPASCIATESRIRTSHRGRYFPNLPCRHYRPVYTTSHIAQATRPVAPPMMGSNRAIRLCTATAGGDGCCFCSEGNKPMLQSAWFIVPVALTATYLILAMAIATCAICSLRGYFFALDRTDAWQHWITAWHHVRPAGAVEGPIYDRARHVADIQDCIPQPVPGSYSLRCHDYRHRLFNRSDHHSDGAVFEFSAHGDDDDRSHHRRPMDRPVRNTMLREPGLAGRARSSTRLVGRRRHACRPGRGRIYRMDGPSRRNDTGARHRLVTHDPRTVPFANRIVHIEDGRILDEEHARMAAD